MSVAGQPDTRRSEMPVGETKARGELWQRFLHTFRLEGMFPTFRLINRFVRESLTAGGKAVLIVMMISVFGLVYLETPLIFLLSSLISIMIVAGVVSFLFRPQLTMEAITPETVMYGEQTEMEIYLRNTRRRATYDLDISPRRIPRHFRVLEEQLPFVEEIRAGTTARTSVPFQVIRRGISRFPNLRASSSFPFNLFRFRQRFSVPGELIVLPRFFPFASFSFGDVAYEHMGELSNNANRSADTDQFLGSREFVPGMPVRRWDYASWARVGKPIVREYQSEQTPMASLFVDTFDDARSSSTDSDTDIRLEAMLSLAASLVSTLDGMDFSIEQMMLGSERLTRADQLHTAQSSLSGGNSGNLSGIVGMGLDKESIFRELALADYQTESHLNQLVENESLLMQDSAFMFMLLAKWDRRRKELLSQLESRRHIVKPILVVAHPDELPVGLPDHVAVVSIDQIQTGRVEI